MAQGRQLERVFHFRALARLERRLKAQSTLQAEDFRHHLERRIRDLTHRLAAPVDPPSWGPRPPQEGGETHESRAGGGAEEAALNAHFLYSRRIARYGGLYLLAVAVGLGVALGALYFDYQIMTEFWTRVLADEFMEVPPSLAGSVVAKSAQVIFATAAFHFLLNSLSAIGRKLFIWLFFVLTFGMVTGFGLLNAGISVPADPEALAPSVSRGPTSLRDALGDLGLMKPEPSPTPSVPGPDSLAAARVWIDAARSVLWLVVPGLVFLTVTGIGALSLQVTERNLSNLMKTRDYRIRRRELAELEELRLYKALLDRMVAA